MSQGNKLSFEPNIGAVCDKNHLRFRQEQQSYFDNNNYNQLITITFFSHDLHIYVVCLIQIVMRGKTTCKEVLK